MDHTGGTSKARRSKSIKEDDAGVHGRDNQGVQDQEREKEET